MKRHKARTLKRVATQVLPCTVSQLLSASEVNKDAFAFGDWELSQVSVVGIIRGFSPFVTNLQYSVDDMTGPPLNVKQWVNPEDCAMMTCASTGMYVKVVGNLHSYSGQRSLLAQDIRCIKDLNEITSHILEVVQAHMRLFGKAFDVNMNTTLTSWSRRHSRGQPDCVLPSHLSATQTQVLQVIRQFSGRDVGISFDDLTMELNFSIRGIRSSLTFLLNEGHVFHTIDEHHFKSTVH